jgi:hypothetical protein
VLEQDLARRNEALVSTRQESLRQGLEIRERRLRELAGKVGPDSPIRRMRLSQIRTLQAQVEGKIVELEGQRTVTVGFQPVAGGLAEIISAGS